VGGMDCGKSFFILYTLPVFSRRAPSTYCLIALTQPFWSFPERLTGRGQVRSRLSVFTVKSDYEANRPLESCSWAL